MSPRFLSTLCGFILAAFATLPLPAAAAEPASGFPDRPDLYVASEQPVDLAGFLARDPLLVELHKTSFYADFCLSNPAMLYQGLSRTADRQLGAPLGDEFLDEMLNAPGETAWWGLQPPGSKKRFLVVRDLSPKFTMIMRLFELLQKRAGKGIATPFRLDFPGMPVWLVIQNRQLIASNEETLLKKALAAAGGANAKVVLARGSPYYARHFTGQPGALKIYVQLSSRWPRLSRLIGTAELGLAINLDLDTRITFRSIYLTGVPPLDLPRGEALRSLARVVPESSVLALSLHLPPERFARQFAEIASNTDWQTELGEALTRDIAPQFSGNLVFFLNGFSQAEGEGVADCGLALSLKKGSGQRQKLVQLAKSMMAPTREEKPEPGTVLLRFDREQAPAVAVNADWLLIAARHSTLEEMRLCLAQKRPNLADQAVAAKALEPLGKRGPVQAVWLPAPFAQALLRHLTYLGGSAGEFAPADVERKIAPALALLARLPVLALTLEPWNGDLKGRLIPLE